MSTTTHVEWLVLVSAIYLDLTLNSFIWIYYNKYIINIFKYIIVDSPVNHVEIYSRLLSCNQVIVSSFKPIQRQYRCWWLKICWWQVSALVTSFSFGHKFICWWQVSALVTSLYVDDKFQLWFWGEARLSLKNDIFKNYLKLF